MSDENLPSVHSEALTSPITQLNDDVLRLIFEAFVTEKNLEASAKDIRFKITTKTAASNLSLVCRRWKDIAYTTPSLWSVIALDLKRSPRQVEEKLNLQTSLAKNIAISLYLQHNLNSNHGCILNSNESRPITCTCCKGNLSLSVKTVAKLHSLRVHVNCRDAPKIFSASNLDLLPNLETMDLSFGDGRSGTAGQYFDVFHLLHHTPRLISLRMHNVLSFQPRNSNASPSPPLQKLRTLTLSCGIPINMVDPNTLVTFLSTCPSVEVLRFQRMISYGWRNNPSIPLYSFSSIHTIITDTFEIIPHITSWFRLPTLREIRIESSDGPFVYLLRSFLIANPTVRKVEMSVKRDTRYDKALQDVLSVEELSISGRGDGQWLSPLYLPIATDETGRPILGGPNLRIIKIYLQDTPLSTRFFEKLVWMRFIVVDSEGHTSAGCNAADILKISSKDSAYISSELMSSPAWRQAVVDRLSKTEYELRWPDRPCPNEPSAQPPNKLNQEGGSNEEEDKEEEEEEEEDYHMFLEH